MPGYTKLNLVGDVEDMAKTYGQHGMQSHVARRPLGLEKQGLSLFRFEAGFRLPFGHRHASKPAPTVRSSWSPAPSNAEGDTQIDRTWRPLPPKGSDLAFTQKGHPLHPGGRDLREPSLSSPWPARSARSSPTASTT